MEQTIKNFNEESDVIIPNVYHIRRFPYYEEVCWEYYDTAGNYHWHGYNTGDHEIKAM